VGGWSQQSGNKKPKRSRRSRQSSNSPGTSFRRKTSSKRGRVDFLELCIDVSLFATLLLVLLCFGGRTAAGQFVLLAGTSLTACLWFIRRGFGSESPWKWTGLEALFLLAIGLFFFQLTPIPDGLINTVSPNLQTYLGSNLPPEIVPSTHISSKWNLVSLAPRESRLSLVAIICVIILFLIMVQQFQNRQRARRVVFSVGLFSALYSVFGIVQYLFGNDKFFWIYEHPYTGTLSYAKGSFTNANHFAGFLALSLGPLLAWTLCRREKKQSQKDAWQSNPPSDWHLILGGAVFAVLLLGIVMTSSRGGLLLAGVGISVTLFFIVIKKMSDNRLPMLLSVGAIISLAGIALLGDKIFERNAEELFSADISKLDRNDARSFIWASNLNAWNQFPWLGTGLGTHENVIPAFHVGDVKELNYTHAENSYLQIGTETGVVGWILLAGSVLVLFRLLFIKIRSAQPGRPETPFYAGIAGSFAVFLVHGCYDFAWYAPAYMLLFGIYLAFLYSSQDEHSEVETGKQHLKFLPFVFAALSIVAGVFASQSVLPAAIAEQGEFQYVKYSHQRSNFESPEEELQLLRLRIISLKQSLQADAEQTDNHLRMARCIRRLFELKMMQAKQAMPVSQIRAAVYSGGFESSEQLQAWLEKPSVMKKTLPMVKASLHHTKQSLRYCPFNSRALLIQSDLCFVESPDALLPEYYLARAELTRPWSPEIPYTAGTHAWSRGDVDTALKIWKEVYPKNEKVAQRIVELLSTVFPPDELVNIFEPDLNQLTAMIKSYKPFESEQGQAATLILARRTLEEAPEMPAQEQEKELMTAFTYLKAARLPDQTLIYIQLAGEIKDDSVKLHNAFGQWLAKNKQFQLAMPHLQFCLKRTAFDPQLEHLLKKCKQHLRLHPQQKIRPASFDSR